MADFDYLHANTLGYSSDLFVDDDPSSQVGLFAASCYSGVFNHKSAEQIICRLIP